MSAQPSGDDRLPGPFRFSILRLMVLTAVAAGLIVYVRAIDVPAAFRVVILAYFAALLGWIVLRLPEVVRNAIAYRRRLRGFRERRDQLHKQYSRRDDGRN